MVGKVVGAEWRCAMCDARLAPRERIGRRDTCPSCGAELHSCRHCQFYEPGAYNDCREPQAERVLDKDRANFCDYFVVAAGQRPGSDDRPDVSPAGDARAKLDALFRKS